MAVQGDLRSRRSPVPGLRMIGWGKKKIDEPPRPRGVARAAVSGCSRDEILHEALLALRSERHADRVGVWLAAAAEASPAIVFHGAVWDRESEMTPVEWNRLSVELLPQEVTGAHHVVEMQLEGASSRVVFGPIVELRSVIWVPVERNGQLCGAILAGAREKNAVLLRQPLERTAADLALALALNEEQNLARERQSDLLLSRQVLDGLSAGTDPSELLQQIVGSCAALSAGPSAGGATFALIGIVENGAACERNPKSETRTEHFSSTGKLAGSAATGKVIFRWSGGDPGWTRAAESEPMLALWREALRSGGVVGSEGPLNAHRHDVARVVAFGLHCGRQALGVLLVGLPAAKRSLATLERLQLRASVAALALAQLARQEEQGRQNIWQQTLLQTAETATIWLGPHGEIANSNLAAQTLRANLAAGENRSGAAATQYFYELFAEQDRIRLDQWIREMHGAKNGSAPADASIEAALSSGEVVAVRCAGVAQAALIMQLEPQDARDGESGAEKAELKSAVELHALLEWMEEGAILFDAEGNVRAMNTRFAQMVGVPAESVRQLQTLEDLVARLQPSAADGAEFARRWRALASAAQVPVREEVQLQRPVARILERAARTITDKDGVVMGRLEIYREVTAQRMFQAKLLQTEKLAALGQMVTSVAHELSNPLTSILGYAQRLQSRNENRESTEARQILQEAERAATISRQLLLNARESLPERRPVWMNEVVERAIDIQRHSMASEGIRLEVQLDPDLPEMSGDAGQLQQVVMNLTGNARQAIHERRSGGTVAIRTKRTIDGQVRLEVQDDGPGIPEAIMARIFDPFFTTKPVGVGTGLGLAIVLSIVREHGGRVNVATPAAGGALFSMEFPASKARGDKAKMLLGTGIGAAPRLPIAGTGAVTKPTRSRAAAAQRNGQGKATVRKRGSRGDRVLIVEDEPTVARLIADVLEDDGFRVEVFLDAQSALERANQENFDLVICDMRMPGLDGQHFYQSLVQGGSSLRKKLVFVTGDVVSQHTQSFLARNGLPHIEKPFRVEELMGCVHEVLERIASVAPEPSS